MFKRAVSIRNKFTVSMVCILLFEAIVFSVFIFFGGTLGMVMGSVYEELIDTTTLRTTAVTSRLDAASAVANSNYAEINKIINSGGTPDAVFSKARARLQQVSSDGNVTGGFIVLGGDINVERMPAFYLRKSDRNLQNQTLSVVISSENVLASSGMLRSQNWSNSLNVKEHNGIDFISEPIALSAAHQDISGNNLGYWSMPYQINFDGQPVIAYCLPLRNAEGRCVGAFGVELSLEQLKGFLPYYEINSSGKGNYVILCKDSYDSNEYKKIICNGENFDNINNYSDVVNLKKSVTKNVYLLDAPKHKGRVYTTLDELTIFGSNSYAHKVWVLCGVVEGEYLNELENTVRRNVLVAFAIALVIGLVFAWLAGKWMSDPLHNFIDEVKKIRADNLVLPPPSDIKELNELGGIVGKLTDDVADFASKVSTILDLSEVTIGAFEYDPKSDVVYCTPMVLETLNMSRQGEKLYVSRSIFEQRLNLFCKNLVPGINQIYTVLAADGRPRYIQLKTEENNGKILGVLKDTTKEVRQEKESRRVKDYDAMTNLLNRTAFRQAITEKFTHSYIRAAAFVHFNIDKMADVNTRFGNSVGDKYIYAAGAALRRYANGMTCTVARTAGDEFKLFITGTNRMDLEARLEEIFRNLYETRVPTEQGMIPMQCSIGVAFYPDDADSSNMLEQYAEFAMRQVKHSTRNNYRLFSKEEYEKAEENIRSSRNIEMLISEGLIRYAFQPIINARTGNIYGYEALMRPDSENAITPHDVMVFATEQNKLDVIERITWFTALENYSMQVDPRRGKKMFINSIPNQLLSTEDIRELEDNYGEFLENIVLEIIENEQTNQEIIEQKKALIEKWNCLLALDDYGSGYANDNTLLALKPDVIKLDIEMIMGIENDKDRQILVRNIIDYAHQKGIKVLGEGVESYTQMETLIRYGVDLLQGFYLAKPKFEVIESIDEKQINEILDIVHR